MLNWRRAFDDLPEAVRSEARAERALAALSEEGDRARADLTSALTSFRVSAADLAVESLGVLIRRAEEIQRKEEDATRREQEAQTALLKVTEEYEQDRERLRVATREWDGWEAEWKQALANAVLDPISSGSGAAAAELLADMRRAAEQAQQHQTTRIDTMNREIHAFEGRVSELISEIAHDLEGIAPEEAVLRLTTRLETDLDQRKERERLAEAMVEIEARIQDRRNALAESEGTLYAALPGRRRPGHRGPARRYRALGSLPRTCLRRRRDSEAP